MEKIGTYQDLKRAKYSTLKSFNIDTSLTLSIEAIEKLAGYGKIKRFYRKIKRYIKWFVINVMKLPIGN